MDITGTEFLEKDGAISLFCELGVYGASFSELNDELDISQTTLSIRLKEARELEFLDKRLSKDDEEGDAIYYPTDTGARFMIQIRRMDVLDAYWSLKQARKQFEERSTEVRQWVSDNPMELGGDRKELIKYLENYHTVGSGSEKGL